FQDGVKHYFSDNSFVICRFSGTEPLLRIFAEASTEEKAQELINRVKDTISK
ncbi:MAG: phosphoglucomutase/phosphomannomutase family protein, partial [Clostridia bacterium]|nr:phosphoglucomutase/phosphomannomutase family protein [Clostridia bacterium]